MAFQHYPENILCKNLYYITQIQRGYKKRRNKHTTYTRNKFQQRIYYIPDFKKNTKIGKAMKRMKYIKYLIEHTRTYHTLNQQFTHYTYICIFKQLIFVNPQAMSSYLT